ncbi:conserved hypothetical protein [Clostridium botulinum C str. Eklund]|nr:conserved hypothetical protein [Clostridium botulinum C str. Eklund]NEZ49934.1 hypothetical protein [Clostridium botulinum]
MKKKLKAVLSILLMIISFAMLCEKRYSPPLGDYLLEFLGLKPWSNNYSGIHITLILFGGVLLLSIFLVKRYFIDAFKINKILTFILPIICIFVVYITSEIMVKSIKKKAPNLLSIGVTEKQNYIRYEFKDNKLKKISTKFKLTNYSNEKKEFYINIDNPFYRKEGTKPIEFYDKQGKPVKFSLEGNESRDFLLTSDEFKIVGGRQKSTGSNDEGISELILSNDQGNRFILRWDEFLK